MKLILVPTLALFTLAPLMHAADAPAPLKVLLITGGCCHDYKAQKDILKKGIEARANVVVDQVHTDDKSTKPPLAILGNPDYAKGYDLVLHDECAADIKDPAIVEGVLKPHRDGIPGVNLHCAMHCYRVGDPGKPQKAGTPESMWFDYLGLQSSGHGPQEPIAIGFTDKEHAIAKGLADWTTITRLNRRFGSRRHSMSWYWWEGRIASQSRPPWPQCSSHRRSSEQMMCWFKVRKPECLPEQLL